MLIQSKRNKHAAGKLMRKLLKKYAFVPERLVTGDLRSYGAAAHQLGIESRHQRGRWKNNRAENSHQPTRRRERKMQRFKSAGGVLEKKGIPSSVITVQMSQQDFTPELLRLMSGNPRPDLLMMIIAGEAVYPIIKQACEQSFAPSKATALYSGGGPALEKELWETAGECAKYLIAEDVALPAAQWNDVAKKFSANFEKQYSRPPTGTAMEAYDDLKIVAQAIRDAGSTKPAAIIQALEKLKFTGTRGEYSFSTEKSPAWAYHQFMKAPIMLIEYDKEGQSADQAPIIYPREWATAKELYLKPGK